MATHTGPWLRGDHPREEATAVWMDELVAIRWRKGNRRATVYMTILVDAVAKLLAAWSTFAEDAGPDHWLPPLADPKPIPRGVSAQVDLLERELSLAVANHRRALGGTFLNGEWQISRNVDDPILTWAAHERARRQLLPVSAML